MPLKGSEWGKGNEAHRVPGESGQAQGMGHPVFPTPENGPDPDHPHSKNNQPRRGGKGQGASMPGSVEAQDKAVSDDEK